VSGGDASEVLEPAPHALDAVASATGRSIDRTTILAKPRSLTPASIARRDTENFAVMDSLSVCRTLPAPVEAVRGDVSSNGQVCRFHHGP
ncbi:MAG: hypothetical protein Q8L92_16320, partial [Rubrivivax sp.]|nr:hypothetical protein [Rubrivivax sp.]